MGHQPLGQRSPGAAPTLDRPDPVRPGCGPLTCG